MVMMTGTENSDRNRNGEQGDSLRGDQERDFGRGTTAGNVGGAWNWDRGPSGDLSGRTRQDFDRYATVREEEEKTTTLF